MNDRKSLLFAELLITLLIAASIPGIMAMIALGPTREWLHAWPLPFIIAWPIAFVLTLFVSRIAFGSASHVFGKRPA